MTLDQFVHRYPIRITQSGCWRWCGCTTHEGTPGPKYGRIWRRSADGKARQLQAHRVAYEIANGPIPAGLVLLNDGCDEYPLCVNPDHWRQVKRGTVVKAMAKVGRTSGGWKHRAATTPGRRRSAKLTIDEARVIRASEAPTALLAAQFDVSGEMIRGIRRGQYWRAASPWTV